MKSLVTDSAIIELRDIIALEYKETLDLEEVRKIAESLIGLYSAILNDSNQDVAYETKRV